MNDLMLIFGLTIFFCAITSLGWGLPRWPKKRRPKLREGEQYVDETDSGKLYLELWKRCPTCHTKPPVYMAGPSGGANQNIFCSYCGQGYNICEMVEIAEVIHKDEKYIQKQEMKNV